MNEYDVTQANACALTNATELAAAVVNNIAGNAISNTIDGKLIDDAFLKEAIAVKFHSTLIPHMGVK